MNILKKLWYVVPFGYLKAHPGLNSRNNELVCMLAPVGILHAASILACIISFIQCSIF